MGIDQNERTDFLITYQDIITRISRLPLDKEFIIKDLFTGIEWDEIDIKSRRAWGTRLLSEVNENVHHNINAMGKTSANAQIYKKIA